MDHEAKPQLDLDAYLSRIAYDGPRVVTAEVLEKLHLAHATHIPFENLDILLGRPIRLDLESLQAKLVRGKRGGYCFEQNQLFAAALAALGFQVTRLAARVRFGARHIAPRTHMLLKVDIGSASLLSDVGFGGEGPLLPLSLQANQIAEHFGWSYRLREDAGFWVLQSRTGEGWLDLYAFTLEPHYDADFEMANYYTSTHPSSHFVRTLTAQLPTPQARYIIRGREFATLRGSGVEKRTLGDNAELLGVLNDTFGLQFPPGVKFSIPA